MSTIFMVRWCTEPLTEEFSPVMITLVVRLFLQEVSSSVVRNMEHIGPAITQQRQVNFKDLFIHSYRLDYQGCFLVVLISQATWVSRLRSCLYSSTSLECGIHSSEHIVILEAHSGNLGSRHSKFRMSLDRQFSLDIVSFTIYTQLSNRQASTASR